MLAIGEKPNGIFVAIDILSMRLHNDREKKREPLPETVELGRSLLQKFSFDRSAKFDHDDHRLSVVARWCLVGPEGVTVTRTVWRNLKNAIGGRRFYGGEDNDLLSAMCKVQPNVMLDELVSGTAQDRQKSIDIIHGVMRHRENPLSVISDDTILQWCDEDPNVRYPFAAATVLLFSRPKDGEPHEWRDIAKLLLQRAPEPACVLQEIANRIWPTSFAGSVAGKYRARLNLFDHLEIGDNPVVRATFDEARAKLVARINKEERTESEESRSQSGFE